MKATDISTGVLNPIRDNCGISRFGASHGSAFRFAIGHHGSKTGYASPTKKPGLAPKRLICAASPYGGEEIAHRSLLLSELDGEEIRLLHHEPQTNRLASERRNIAPILPTDLLIDRVADKVTAVGQCKVRERLAGFILDFNSYTAAGAS